MRQDRRKFVIGAALVAGGAAAGGLHWVTRGPRITAQNEAEEEVFSALRSYGEPIEIQRSGNDGRRVTLVAELEDHREFMGVYADREALPSDVTVRAEGNRLSFDHRGIAFTVEHRVSKRYLDSVHAASA